MKKTKTNKGLQVETRKNEIQFSTTDCGDMLNKYLAETLKRTWSEDFIDDATGEVVSIERSEVIAQKGMYIDANLLSSINFHLIAKDIKEVVVSNQQREATHTKSGVGPWSISAIIGTKKHRILLYANSIQMALDIAKDFIELTFEGLFQILNVKDFNNCIIINDVLRPLPNNDDDRSDFDKRFYQIEVKIHKEDYDYQNTFVLQAIDVDSAMIVINDWLKNSIREKNEKDGINESLDFNCTIESAVIIPCSKTIDKEFTLAYTDNEY